MRLSKSIAVSMVALLELLGLPVAPLPQSALADSLHKRNASANTAKAPAAAVLASEQEELSLLTPRQSSDEGKAAPAVEKYLRLGKLQKGESELAAQLKRDPEDDQLRFGLGMLQVLRAIERLAQDLYRYGLRDEITRGIHIIPQVNLPVSSNPHPERLDYENFRNIIDTFGGGLLKAEATLATVRDPDVKLPLHFGLIRLDLNGNGKAEENEALWKLYAGISRRGQLDEPTVEKFYISFDRGDVHWLRGYCHVFMALCDMYLAYDSKDTFERTAHVFFPDVNTPYAFLRGEKNNKNGHHLLGDDGIEDGQLLDLLALIHLIRWQVVAPEHMTAALHHLEAIVAQSKESWKWILAEKDDDHEWLPNPRQTGVIPNLRVNSQMVDSWQEMMDEAGQLLEGKLLIPFWRGSDGRGLNLRRVFLEPRTFDLLLWVQGSAAVPYLEKGPILDSKNWMDMQRNFGSEFPIFAAWFN